MLPTLTGEEREVTISFSDIEGFTSFSETLDPKTLLSTLNGFFEIANSTIIANK
jgi:adenylate cyclase